jgi:hypothetical protein
MSDFLDWLSRTGGDILLLLACFALAGAAAIALACAIVWVLDWIDRP